MQTCSNNNYNMLLSHWLPQRAAANSQAAAKSCSLLTDCRKEPQPTHWPPQGARANSLSAAKSRCQLTGRHKELQPTHWPPQRAAANSLAAAKNRSQLIGRRYRNTHTRHCSNTSLTHYKYTTNWYCVALCRIDCRDSGNLNLLASS
jgi:hypothetical protein